MKFLHISDLHLGKRLNEFSLIEDQAFILNQICDCIKTEKPDALLIAGDIYDKGIPSVEAVNLFDGFLNNLAELKCEVFIISGNHDSSDRLVCGSKLMANSGVHFARTYDGNVKPYVLQDSNGPVNIYLLPFIKPAVVKSVFPDDAETINSYTDAVKCAISHMNVNTSERNILVAHQFVTGSTRSDSEDISVGGSDNVDSEVFSSFDYVALGHLHGPQKAGSEIIRYCGTPLKYSFSETAHKKSMLIINLEKKGDIQFSTIPFKPLHDLREIRGTYEELTFKKNYENTAVEDYLHITLTDEDDIPEGFAKLQVIYPNLVKLDYDNKRTRTNNEIEAELDVEHTSPIDLFEGFFKLQNNSELSDEQKSFTQKLIEDIWGGEK